MAEILNFILFDSISYCRFTHLVFHDHDISSWFALQCHRWAENKSNWIFNFYWFDFFRSKAGKRSIIKIWTWRFSSSIKTYVSVLENSWLTNFAFHLDSSLANGFRVLYKGKARLANEQELNFAEKSNTVSELDQNLSSSDTDLNSLKVYFFNPIFIDKFQFTNENRFLNNIYVNEAVFFKSKSFATPS